MSHHKDSYWAFSMNWFESYKKSPIKESIYYHKVMWPFEFSRSKQWQFSQRMVSLSKELAHFKKRGAVVFWELLPFSKHGCLATSTVPQCKHGTLTTSTVPLLQGRIQCTSSYAIFCPSTVQLLQARFNYSEQVITCSQEANLAWSKVWTYVRWKRNGRENASSLRNGQFWRMFDL